MAEVSILKVNPSQSVQSFKTNIIKLLEPLGGISNFVKSGDKVLLKPNVCVATTPNTGRITDPDLVEAVAMLALEAGAECVWIGESCLAGGDMDEAYSAGGYDRFKEIPGTLLVNLKKEPYRTASVDKPMAMECFDISERYFDADTVINLPKMKTIASTGISVSMKNLKGLIRDTHKRRCHYTNLSEAVVDLNGYINVDLNIVDGAVGFALHSPIEHGVLLASPDRVALDTVAAMCMDVNPEDVKHLCISSEKGLGEMKLDEIDILGDTIESVVKAYPQAQNDSKNFEKTFPEIPVSVGTACSACIAVTEAALRSLQAALNDKNSDETEWARKWKDHLVLAVGKDAPTDFPGKTVLRLGNCLAQDDKNSFIPGCPFLAADALDWLKVNSP